MGYPYLGSRRMGGVPTIWGTVCKIEIMIYMWVPSFWETTVYYPFLVIVVHEHIGSIDLLKFDDSRKCVISNILSPAGVM